MTQLTHENEVFLDAFHEDGLLIMARGLGVERVFSSFLKLYSDPGNLVLVLNTSASEEEYLLDQLKNTDIDPLPKVVTTEYSINDRKDLYLQGGVLFVTSRILVVDMLTDRLPIHLVTGILVYNAHKIIDSCQEAFILRLYRQKNKKGFIKAFSDSPVSFTAGFCHVERVMKSLFVRKLFLWPRFHASVMSTLEKHKVDVVELYVQLTSSMVACQTSLLDLIDACIKELKKNNVALDTDEITVENAITHSFDKIVKLHLEPIWHQLSPTTKQLISDVKTLRLLLEYLMQYDCINFYNLVSSIRSSEKQFGTNSGWLFLDSADSLFAHARQRVFGAQKSKKQKTGQSSETKELANMEECPKWNALSEVLKEIEEENKDMLETEGLGNILVVGQDDRTCNQIKEYLSNGGKSLLERLYNKSQKIKTGKQQAPFKGKGTKWKQKEMSKDTLTLTQMIDPRDDDEEEDDNAATDEADKVTTAVKPLKGSNDPFSLQRTLKELQPRFVVMYDAEMAFVRQLEIFRATRPGKPLRCYFLMYTGSSEEQKYLTSLRKEKEAFEYLIREKATMVIPEEREGRLEDDPELSRDVTPANKTTNTRKAGGQKKDQQSKIIVDMREFRSELPSLVHKRGIDIEPVTIEVGDYILTPDICVERKSISDLIGSLNNGRLYNQCVSMCRFYRRPVLLIEFDPNKAFTLQGKYTLRDDITSSDVMSRLTLLTIHFPRLRILWCQGPYVTAQLFQEIKDGRPEPSAEQALAVSMESAEDLTSDKYSHGPQSMLLKMPGINSKNVGIIMNKVSSMCELIKLSLEELSSILQSEANAKRLHTFLHNNYSNMPQTTRQSSTSKMIAAAAARSKFKGKKK